MVMATDVEQGQAGVRLGSTSKSQTVSGKIFESTSLRNHGKGPLIRRASWFEWEWNLDCFFLLHQSELLGFGFGIPDLS